MFKNAGRLLVVGSTNARQPLSTIKTPKATDMLSDGNIKAIIILSFSMFDAQCGLVLLVLLFIWICILFVYSRPKELGAGAITIECRINPFVFCRSEVILYKWCRLISYCDTDESTRKEHTKSSRNDDSRILCGLNGFSLVKIIKKVGRRVTRSKSSSKQFQLLVHATSQKARTRQTGRN